MSLKSVSLKIGVFLTLIFGKMTFTFLFLSKKKAWNKESRKGNNVQKELRWLALGRLCTMSSLNNILCGKYAIRSKYIYIYMYWYTPGECAGG